MPIEAKVPGIYRGITAGNLPPVNEYRATREDLKRWGLFEDPTPKPPGQALLCDCQSEPGLFGVNTLGDGEDCAGEGRKVIYLKPDGNNGWWGGGLVISDKEGNPYVARWLPFSYGDEEGHYGWFCPVGYDELSMFDYDGVIEGDEEMRKYLEEHNMILWVEESQTVEGVKYRKLGVPGGWVLASELDGTIYYHGDYENINEIDFDKPVEIRTPTPEPTKTERPTKTVKPSKTPKVKKESDDKESNGSVGTLIVGIIGALGLGLGGGKIIFGGRRREKNTPKPVIVEVKKSPSEARREKREITSNEKKENDKRTGGELRGESTGKTIDTEGYFDKGDY